MKLEESQEPDNIFFQLERLLECIRSWFGDGAVIQRNR